MAYWLVKTDPDSYSWQDFLAEIETDWDGVRNYQARLNLLNMDIGDSILVYESQTVKSVVGIAEVTKKAFQDTTSMDDRWVAVRLKVNKSLNNPVTLAMIKSEPMLLNVALVKQSRLSVMPLNDEEYHKIISLSE
ncbi:MAG: EVE domain-containing protein [Candidatus Kapabacteria bacterium]|nr:EVE domain-containing protein [Candidatus Kapabacteria bacterium]